VNYATHPHIGGYQRIDLEADAITREGIVASITKNLSDTLLLGLHILRRKDSARMEIRAIALTTEATLLYECILGVKMLGNTTILNGLREAAYTKTAARYDGVCQASSLGLSRIHTESRLSLEVAHIVHRCGEVGSTKLSFFCAIEHRRISPLTQLTIEEAITLRVTQAIEPKCPVKEPQELCIGALWEEGLKISELLPLCLIEGVHLDSDLRK